MRQPSDPTEDYTALSLQVPPSTTSQASEEAIPGIRYPASWGQHRSMSPQGTSMNISEGSDESFHSAESRGVDYSILSSIDPPRTKIMVSQYDYTHYYTVMYTW